MTEEKRAKIRKGLSIKLTVGFILFALAITVAAVAVGVRVYQSNSATRYNEIAYEVASATQTLFTEEELLYYSDKIKAFNAGEITLEELKAVAEAPEYKTHFRGMNNLRKSMRVNDILLFYMDPDSLVNYSEAEAKKREVMPMQYILDSYYDEAGRVFIGESWWIKEQYAATLEEALRTGKNAEGHIITKGAYGYTISAYQPVVVNNETIAMIGVEVPMSTLISDCKEFAIRIGRISAIVTVGMLVLALWLIFKWIINPVVLMATEADSFLTNDNQVSERLPEIRTRDEIQSLSESILAMEIGINEYIDNLTRVTAEKERIGAELNVATKIQADMLPTEFPDREEFKLYATMDPAKEVGGDFYDFFFIDENHLCLVIADVSGKGVPAALFMVIAKTLLKNVALQGHTPKEILEIVNNQLYESNGAELFVTVWLGIMDIRTGHFFAANAGHEYPTIRKAGGQFELIKDKHGMPLGGLEGIRYKEYEFDLEAGGTLYVYTDGVAEATNAENELFGTERMLEALNQNPDRNPDVLLPGVREVVDGFVKEAPQFDDITMLAIKRS